MTLISVIIPTYRDSLRARDAVASVAQQTLPAGVAIEVIVVDDGSGDDNLATLSSLDDGSTRILSLAKNEGRSAARNAGAATARGSILVFMDCDCRPANQHFLSRHCQSLANAVASTGAITGDGSLGFWDRYQQEASARRRRQYRNGLHYTGSSANLAVLADAFKAIGGFDTGFGRYGFEDRDLLLRLTTQGAIAWTDDADVRHIDALSLTEVAGKMREAGRISSIRFSERHPAAYQALGHARIDARLHQWLKYPARILGPVALLIARAFDWLGTDQWLPYPMTRTLVGIVTAASYLHGTSLPKVDD